METFFAFARFLKRVRERKLRIDPADVPPDPPSAPPQQIVTPSDPQTALRHSSEIQNLDRQVCRHASSECGQALCLSAPGNVAPAIFQTNPLPRTAAAPGHNPRVAHRPSPPRPELRASRGPSGPGSSARASRPREFRHYGVSRLRRDDAAVTTCAAPSL